MNVLTTIALLLCCLGATQAQDVPKDDAMKNCPMHARSSTNNHRAVIEKHGDEGMGFSHLATTHHFWMVRDGGVIEVTTNDAKDTASRDAIRSHLSHIAVLFSNGDFSTPMFVHDGIPPGVTTMKLLKPNITYTYQELEKGGRVRIASSDPVAVAAVHDFLRFQIMEHQTGDSLDAEGGN